MMKPLIYWVFLFILLSCCLEMRRASEIQFQSFDMSLQYLSSASVCNRTSTSGIKNRASTLEVVHRYGPCAQTGQNRPVNSPSFAKILANDRLRVKSIQARAKPDPINKSKNPNKSCRDKRTQIPAQSGDLFNVNDYIVTIGLGTPERRFSLFFDTGSFLTWTQCQPCIKHCYRQKDAIFNPYASTSYSNISCESKDCPQDFFGCYHNVMCVYGVGYGDKSYTIGFLSKDKLTVTPIDVFPGFLFGCGQNNSGLFGLTDGLLGLSRGPLSFVNQTAKTYGQHFSYCLPTTKNSTGFLAFGKNNKAKKKVDDAADDDDDDAKMIFTPFIQDPIFYVIEITAISVGGTRLKINGSVFTKIGTIIDSGTEITRLPSAAYKTMSEEFKEQMNKLNYKSAPTYADFFDTCFYIPRYKTVVKVPTVSFTFKGNATINLDASGTLVSVNSKKACLAFVGNSDPSDLAVFGNRQQHKFEVAYDVAGNKLGFARNPNCQ